MALQDDIAALAQAPLLSLFEPDALRLIAFAAEPRKLRAGDVLFRKGERSDGGYVVTAGAVALNARDDGSEADFIARPGALIGQLSLFVRRRRPATAIAREPSQVLRISPTLIRRVLDEFPHTAATLQDAIARDLAELTEGLEGIRTKLNAEPGKDV